MDFSVWCKISMLMVFQYIVKAKDSIIFLIIRTLDGEIIKRKFKEKFFVKESFIIALPKFEMCAQIA